MNNPYCKHGNHHAIRCLLCEQDKRGKRDSINSLVNQVNKIEEDDRREAIKKKIQDAAKRLDW